MPRPPHTSPHSELKPSETLSVSLGVNSASTVAQRGLGLARGVVLGWLIPARQYGLLGLATLVTNVLLPLCALGLYEGIARFTPLHEARGSLRRFIRSCLVLLAIVACLSAGIVYLFAPELAERFFLNAEAAALARQATEQTQVTQTAAAARVTLVRAVAFCVASLCLYHCVLNLARGRRRFRTSSLIEVTQSVVITVIAVGGAMAGWTDAVFLVHAYTASNLITIVLLMGPIRRLGTTPCASEGMVGAPPDPQSHETPAAPGICHFMVYSFWAALSAVLWQGMILYPMWRLLWVADESTVGAYQAMRTITQVSHLAAVTMTSAIAAHATRLWEAHGRAAAIERLDAWTNLSLLVLVAAGALMSAGRPLAVAMFPPALSAGAACYEPLLVFFLLMGAVGLLAVRINLVQKPRLLFLSWAIGLGVTIYFANLLTRSPQAQADPVAALSATAWGSTMGVFATLVLLVILAGLQRVGIRPATLLLLAALCAPGLGPVAAAGMLAIMLALSLCTEFVLSRQDRAAVGQAVVRLLRRRPRRNSRA